MLLLNSCVIATMGVTYMMYYIRCNCQKASQFARVPNKDEIGSSLSYYVRYVSLRHSEKMGIFGHCSHICYLANPIRLAYIYIHELLS